MVRSPGWLVASVAVVVINTWASLSSAVVGWFGGNDDDAGATWVPRFVVWTLERRPDVGDADMHLIMWFVAAAVTTRALVGLRWWAWGVAAVWGWSLVLEILQPVVSTERGRELGDAVGNTLGMALGVGVVCWWPRRRNGAG